MPTAFDAHGNATTRVRSFSRDASWVEIEPALVVDVGEAHGQVAVVRDLEPGGDVAVVIEPRADDLVAGLPLARGRA